VQAGAAEPSFAQAVHGHGAKLDSREMAGDFAAVPDTVVEHFFVNSDSADPKVSELIGGLDPSVEEPTSITRFLTLPTVTWQRHTKIRDLIFDFSLPQMSMPMH
jgi:hypothetical protein